MEAWLLGVKRTLEYATSFVYQGKTHHWPEANVAITGAIPELEITEDGARIKK